MPNPELTASPYEGFETTGVNDPTLVATPPGPVTEIGPAVKLPGDVTVIDVSLTTVMLVPAVPSNDTAVAPVNPLPVIVTLVLVP